VKKLKYQVTALIWMLSVLLIDSIPACAGPTLAVRMGSESFLIRQNITGKAIVPMEEVKVKAMKLQEDGKTIKEVETIIKVRTVIRVGIQYIGRDDQILTREKVQFAAMVPDETGKNLVKVDKMTVDENTGIKIGTAIWEPMEKEAEVKPVEAKPTDAVK